MTIIYYLLKMVMFILYYLYSNTTFGNEEVQKMVNHTLSCMSKESLDEQVQKYGSMEKYKEYLISGFANERATADLLKWYGSKEKVMEAVMQSTGVSKK